MGLQVLPAPGAKRWRRSHRGRPPRGWWHTLISRFVDHRVLPAGAINARAGVHTPRSTLAQWCGRAGAALEPIYDVHKRFVLASAVLHADETPVAMLDPGAGKTRKAYVWAYARGAFDPTPGVVYDFCLGRGAHYPIRFLGPPREGEPGWRGTLVRDEYGAYESVVDPKKHPGRIASGCLAHARRKFDELIKHNASVVAPEALRRIAEIYRAERELVDMSAADRLAARKQVTEPLWKNLRTWLEGERAKVPNGSATAKALDYSLKHWTALTRNLLDGDVPVDNNHLENQIRPWAMGRRNAKCAFMRTRVANTAMGPRDRGAVRPWSLRIITALAGTPAGPWAGGTSWT